MRTITLALLVLAAGCAGKNAPRSAAGGADRIFELRTYTTHPGKLEALHRRFRDHTNRLFVKHGAELIGYWTPADGPVAQNTLIYVLAYPSRAAREKMWKDFMDDPEWKAAFTASHQDGVIVAKVESTIMAATDYSPIR